MSDVDRLLTEYIEEHRAGGEADPVAYLERVEGTERDELGTLIDAYLQRTPPKQWDADAYRGSASERLVESLDRALVGQAGMWPVVLPRLRERAKVLRTDLVERLADALGVGDRSERVGDYYHLMEQGRLDPSGVSDRVLDALGGIVGVSASSLRQAGEPMPGGPLTSDLGDAVFMRQVRASDDEARDSDSSAAEARPARPAANEWDEVDQLFRGG